MKRQRGIRRNHCLIRVFHGLREQIISSNIPIPSLTVNKVITHLGPNIEQYSQFRRSIFSQMVKCIIKSLRQERDERKSARKSGGGSKSRANDSQSRLVTAEAEPLQRRRAADNSAKNSNTSVFNDFSTPTLNFESSDRAHKLSQSPVDDTFQEMNVEPNIELLGSLEDDRNE